MHSERIPGRINLLPKGEYRMKFLAGLVQKVSEIRKKPYGIARDTVSIDVEDMMKIVDSI